MTGRTESLLELLIRQESKVAELYQLFSERDPDHRDFWRSMADAELHHVSMIHELQGYIPSRQALLIEGKVRAGTVKSFLAYVDGLLLRAKKEALPFTTALSLSMDIEKSLVEKGMLDHFHGASAEVNAVLDRLKQETAGHGALMEEMWRRNRSPGK